MSDTLEQSHTAGDCVHSPQGAAHNQPGAERAVVGLLEGLGAILDLSCPTKRVESPRRNLDKVWDVAHDLLRHETTDYAGYCRRCGTARKANPCQKCGFGLEALRADHEEPRLPDVGRVRALAREVGYGIGLHGTMERDLDLIAVPWVQEAVSAPELAAHIAVGLNAFILNDKVQDKPCGRWSCSIQIDGWFKVIDLSVMPPTTPASESAVGIFAPCENEPQSPAKRQADTGPENMGGV